jgi:preprotein translocase subunit SecG
MPLKRHDNDGKEMMRTKLTAILATAALGLTFGLAAHAKAQEKEKISRHELYRQ